jgi:hypothetical protein
LNFEENNFTQAKSLGTTTSHELAKHDLDQGHAQSEAAAMKSTIRWQTGCNSVKSGDPHR